jgi:signal transduction histidine kinase
MKALRLGILLIFFTFLSLLAQDESVRVVLVKLTANGKVIVAGDNGYYLIKESDRIEFFYHLNNTGSEKIPFRFLTNLKFGDQEYPKPTNNSSIDYSGLKESKYELTVSALDPKNQFKAAPLIVNFKVSDSETRLLAENEKLIENNKRLDSLANLGGAKIGEFKFDYKSAAIGAGLCFICCVFIAMIYKLIKIFNKSNKGKKMSDTMISISKEEYDRLIRENSDLKTEVNALRNQIDNLSVRSQDLNAQNKELKEKVDKLSATKSELEDLQKQKDDLFAMVIHDIKNPAGLIKSLVELLKSYDLSATEQREIIDDIVVTSSRIVNLSQEVTKILALESSSMRMNIEKYPLSEIIRDVNKRNSIAAQQKDIDVQLEIKDLPPIPLDAQKVDEVIDNLLSNAIKFSPKGGKVKITLRKEGDYAEVSVKDNGLGLSQEDISKAFQRGVKLSAQPTNNEHSSGFGLWIVKKLVEAHQGRVRITSALGKGSTFSALFPVKGPSKIED